MQFQHIPFLKLGAQSRADWVANGVLYLPLALFTAHMFSGARRAPVLALAAALGFCIALAVLLEFAQLAFPPRTVSLNDLIAEMIGSTLGVLLAAGLGERLHKLFATLAGDQTRLTDRLLKAYALAYFAFSLFPFDFFLSASEIDLKLASDNIGWWLAPSLHEGGVSITIAKLGAEVLAAAPVGFLLTRCRRGRRHWPSSQVLLAGAGMGLLIEFAQFFAVSGVSQGISVLTRAAGMLAGTMLWRQRERLHPLRIAAAIRRRVVWFGLGYLLALVSVTGWFELDWRNVDQAWLALQEVRFLPFYYHYYTTEQAALLSLTSVCLMYAPLGILAWATWHPPAWGLWMAAFSATVVETSKLFLHGQHPDPSNVFIAGLAAWSVVKLVRRLSRYATELSAPVPMPEPSHQHWQAYPRKAPVTPAESPTSPDVPFSFTPSSPSVPGYLALAATGLGASWAVATYSLHPIWLGLALSAYAALIWFKPQSLVMAVPAALPLLDFAPWSGRFYLDEFDMLLALSLAVGYARVAPTARQVSLDRLFKLLSGLVALSFAIGAVRGLMPWQWPDMNALNNYYSPYNGLRIAKGALWAFLLHGLLGRMAASGLDVPRLFGQGLVIGLVGTVAYVIWERAAFPGLFNFADVYRVTGPFSQMHVGGADLETFLTLATPYLVWQIFTQRTWATRIAGIALLLGATYAVMVTFSRVGYVGYGIAVGLSLLIAWAASGKTGLTGGLRGWVAVALLASLTAAVALPVLSGRFAQERLSQSGTDLATRQAHWQDALAMRDPDWATTLFGMGLGRYPETHYWRSMEIRAAPYRLMNESDNTFLRLSAGSPLYMEQLVHVLPGQTYVFKAMVRTNEAHAPLTVSLCEKWLLTSARCAFQALPAGTPGTWQGIEASIATGEVGKAPWFAPRPVKLSLYNATPKALLDVDQVSLQAPDGTQLLENTDFSAGLDRWFFSVDNDRPWHIWSLPVQVLFDQGWFGVMALGAFIALGLWRNGRATWRGQLAAGIPLAATLGWVVIGSLDSLVDSPRLLLLTLLLVSLKTCQTTR